MKSKEEQKHELGLLTFNEIKRLELITGIIERITEKKVITEDVLREVTNMYSEIHILKEGITKRLISCLKQGYLLD